jgi:hypothetical protein
MKLISLWQPTTDVLLHMGELAEFIPVKLRIFKRSFPKFSEERFLKR